MTLLGIILTKASPSNALRPRTGGRPTREAAAARSADILDVAQPMFFADGFERTSLDKIATVAGATKRTLYVKFGNKAGLLSAVVGRVLETAYYQVEDPGPGTSVEQRLRTFMSTMLNVALSAEILGLYWLLQSEASRFPDLAAHTEAALSHGAENRLAAILRSEATSGRLMISDPAMSARLLTAMALHEPQRARLMNAAPWPDAYLGRYLEAALTLFLSAHEMRREAPADLGEPLASACSPEGD